MKYLANLLSSVERILGIGRKSFRPDAYYLGDHVFQELMCIKTIIILFGKLGDILGCNQEYLNQLHSVLV